MRDTTVLMQKKIDPTCLIKCFELQEEKEGVLCDACRRLISKHKQDHSRRYPLVVNSRGRTGISNRKQAIVKRTEHLLSFKNDSCVGKRPRSTSPETVSYCGSQG